MSMNLFRAIRAIGLVLILSTAAAAQQVPSPAQAQQMLKNDPALIGRLQQMMRSSGLSPDQIRERLKEQGYPEALLDQYLPGSVPNDSTALLPGDDVFAAVRALGLADSTAIDSLTNTARSRQRVRARVDSAFLDTLQRALQNDSLRSAVRMLLQSREQQRMLSDSGFRTFGLDLFTGDTKLFAANISGAADAGYRFGPGDQLVLILTGDFEKSYKLTVTRDGFIVIPEVGQVNVSGLTRAQLEDALYSRLGRAYSGIRRGPGATTHFYIDVNQMGANQIFVHGDVVHPSSYQVSRAGTVMTALYLAGGPTSSGTLRGVQVRRNGQTVATVDVYDYALRGDASHDVRLENGDIVFVPSRGPQARVAGAVLRPATYEVKPGQTVADVIEMAGGFAESADRRRLQIDRIAPPAERTSAGADRRVVDVPADLFASAPVRGGDVIRVLEVAKRVASRINVKGNVWTPGPLGFTPGMRLYDALRRAGGLKPDSYLGDVLITRLRADSTREVLRSAVYDTTGRPVTNMELADGDELQVFSTTEFRPKRYVTVSGAVRKAGRIPFREGMTLHDAVLLAGGMTEGALLTQAEIARLPANRAAGVTATPMTVPLDSTYVFERGANGQYVGGPGGGEVPRGVLRVDHDRETGGHLEARRRAYIRSLSRRYRLRTPSRGYWANWCRSPQGAAEPRIYRQPATGGRRLCVRSEVHPGRGRSRRSAFAGGRRLCAGRGHRLLRQVCWRRNGQGGPRTCLRHPVERQG
jgi:polysaccharide export outer membrane protein